MSNRKTDKQKKILLDKKKNILTIRQRRNRQKDGQTGKKERKSAIGHRNNSLNYDDKKNKAKTINSKPIHIFCCVEQFLCKTLFRLISRNVKKKVTPI